jgi:hypothetical protein
MDAQFYVEHYRLLDWDIAFCHELKVAGRKILVELFELFGYVFLTVCRKSHCCKFHWVTRCVTVDCSRTLWFCVAF